MQPSLPCLVAIAGLFLTALASGALVWAGKIELLDWLYVLSSLKLFVTAVKYVPQILLDVKLKSAEGFAVGQVTSVSPLLRIRDGMHRTTMCMTDMG